MVQKLNLHAEITVILINYNQSKYLRDAIKSVLNQSYKDYELIIIDNGSIDNSKKIIETFLNDNRINYLNYNKNDAVTKRLNHAISIAKGKYINFLMADDMIEKNKLNNQLNIFKKLDDDYGIVYGPSIIINENNKKNYLKNFLKINGNGLSEQLKKNLVNGHINFNSALIKKKCLIDYPMLETIFIETESIFLCFALKYKFKYDSNPVCYFREHSENIGKKIFDNLDRHIKRIEELRKFNLIEKKCKDEEIQNYKGNIILNIIWYNLRTNGVKKKNWKLIREIIKNHKYLLIKIKFFLSLILTFTPNTITLILNYIIDRIRRTKHNNIRLD